IPVLNLGGAEGRIIATDGNPLPSIPVKGWKLGPAMRVDIAFRMPDDPGAVVELQNIFGTVPKGIARITSDGTSVKAPEDWPQLAASHVPEADLKSAERISFDLTAGHISPELE